MRKTPLKEYLLDYFVPLQFNFWEIVARSKMMIKLDLIEIKKIQSLYDYITSMNNAFSRKLRFNVNPKLLMF